MSLADVLARAREQAPRIVAARLGVEEARARLTGASLRFQTNPEVDASIGSRDGDVERSTAFDIGVMQMLEPSGRRDARIAAANAAIERSTAVMSETTRVVLRDAAFAFYRGVHARERTRILQAAEELASAVHQAVDRRYKAGDVAVLEVNVARTSLARVRADREAAAASSDLATGELKQLLGLTDEIELSGTLTGPGRTELEAMLLSAAERPELKELEAAVREAEADARLGGTFGKPEFGLGARYERDEGDNTVLGSVTMTLPTSARGQELQAAGAARAARLRTELEAARARVRLEVQSNFKAYERRLAALRILETDALPGMDENQALTTRSYEVGQIGLPELLLLRREILDTRLQYIDALLDAALTRIDLDSAAGVLR
jgi:cobalt-zinc-cadmium efflux system outer membrane protein